MKNRDNLYKKLKKDPDNDTLRITYNRYRNFCSSQLKKAKRTYERQEIAKHKTNKKKLWESIKNISGINRTVDHSPKLLGQHNSQSSINKANEFFSSVGRILAEKHNCYKSSSPRKLSKPSSLNSIVLLPTTADEVYSTILGLRNSCAIGYDQISAYFIKRYAKLLSDPIAHLCNLALTTGAFPDAFKIALVKPIYKAGDKSIVGNYRPISILPAMSKILERLINWRLVDFLEKNHLLASSQYGFRRGKSTSDAVHDLHTNIVTSLDSKQKCLTIFIDLAKAFDTVSTSHLLSKLYGLGIRGLPLQLLQSYLNNRRQRVKILDMISDECIVNFGVPQGSILGPTLFLVYINELCQLELKGGKIFAYADDTALYFVGKTWREVFQSAQLGFQVVVDWLHCNVLTLNIEKTKYMTFALQANILPPDSCAIKAHNADCSDQQNCHCPALSVTNNVKYLGVIIDRTLTFRSHIEALATRLRKLIYVFRTLKHVADRNTIKMILYALCQSIVDYCILSWGGAAKTLLIEAERAHRAILKLGETRSSSFGPATYQDFKDIRARCLADGRLFEDPEFPAIDRSLYYKERLDRPITWLRPGEIANDPQLFVEGYSRFDVQQGELGDCWLLAAVANLTLHRKLFFQVVPDDQSFDEEYAGVFHFRFWQYGRWVDVVIDDRLPTYRGKLVFLHSSETNEFWSALLEKAYAKLHGSYEALKGGSTCEAMEDFTGGVTEMYDMAELPPNFYTILLKAYERNSLMGCSIEPDPNILEAETPVGLIRGHAYSVTRVKYVDIETPGRAGKIPLLRLRNPWGNEAEWNGPWSDKSPEWRFIPESEKEELGLNFDDDGEFWMSFKDFCQHFDRVEICNLNPDSLDPEECPEGCTKKWEMSVFEGEWVRGVTAGGCRNYLESFWRNPQYTITLKDVDEDDEDNKCTIIIALMQKNRRSQRHQGLECLTIGFAVYRLPEYGRVPRPLDENYFKYNASVGRSQAFINLREVSARFKFEPGQYVIVPSTFEPNEEGEFLLRVFSEKDNNMAENDEDIGMGDVDDRVKEVAPAPEPADPVRDFFTRLAGADGEVDWQELKEILDYAMREELAMSRGGAYDGGGGGGLGGPGSPAQEQSCLEALLCALCSPICKELGVDLQQMQQEQVHLNQPQHQELKGQGFSKEVCRSMIAMLDKDNSGGLGFDEFKTLWVDLRNWRAVFRLYDSEGRGAVPAHHLRDALHSAGYTVNAHILNVLAHRYGGSDGYIQFDDFIMCAVRLKTMIANNEPLENLERELQSAP